MLTFFKMIYRTTLHIFAMPLPEELEDAIKSNNFSEFKGIITSNPALVHSQNRNYETPLFLLVTNPHTNSLKMAELLLKNGAIIDAVNHMGSTPLCEAAYKGNSIAAHWLLQNGANVNHQRVDGESPLMQAVIFSTPDMVRLLVQHRANVNIKDSWRGQNTPLHYAAEMGDIEMMTILLAAGADVNAKTGYFSCGKGTTQTPLHHMISLIGIPYNARATLQNYFSQRTPTECQTEKRGDYAYTPLHLASLYGHSEAVKLLLQQNGIKRNALDSGGKTALELANEAGQASVVEILENFEPTNNVQTEEAAELSPPENDVEKESHASVGETLENFGPTNKRRSPGGENEREEVKRQKIQIEFHVRPSSITSNSQSISSSSRLSQNTRPSPS